MADSPERVGRSPLALILRLATKDLRHEWILSLCLVMAVAAVLGPILILLGLKFGSIQILRSRLVEDPRNREIRPMISTRFEQPWFARVAERPEVAFVIPMTRQISTSVTGCTIDSDTGGCGSPVELDLLPTGDGDPLLVDNGSLIPSSTGCTLTARGAEEMGAKVGDSLEVTVKRLQDGVYEKVGLQLKVEGILDARAGTTNSLFVGLPLLEAVERYKDGAAVPAYNWPGRTLTAYAQYDGLIIWLDEPLTRLNQVMLKNNTGFARIDQLSADQLRAKTGLTIDRPGTIYLLTTLKKAAGEENLEIIRNRLRGKTHQIFPWVRPMTATLTLQDQPPRQVELFSLGYARELAATLAINPAPRWSSLAADRQSDWLVAMAETAATAESPEVPARLQISRGGNDLELALTLSGIPSAGEVLYIPSQLGSMFRLLDNRQVAYDETSGQFVLNRQGYAGFRLYATTIDAVDGLRREFEAEGIPVATQADRIRDVQELDRYLTIIFWVIAVAAAGGGIATLAASLYASVERKRRELGVLRLLGLSRLLLFRFPVYQGLLLCLGGLATAFAFFFGLATLINRLFGAMMRPGESLCTLSIHHLTVITLIILGIAVLSATGAAWRVTRLEPVEALRDE